MSSMRENRALHVMKTVRSANVAQNYKAMNCKERDRKSYHG